MDERDVKRALRKLKLLENKLRQGHDATPTSALVWDRFFDLREATVTRRAKYTLQDMVSMSRDAYKAAIDEYWSYVYYELFNESDWVRVNYDADALSQLGLPFDADAETVKKRFRELAKLYHPDTGGDAGKFIELMDAYRRLISK